jgi:N-acetylglucosamine kinase-like BadF-type ATPase
VEEVSAGLHLGDLDRERVNDLSPLLFAIAAGGDEVARRVVAKQAREVVALATVAARRLGLLDKAYSVVLGGGVLAARHPLLHDAVVDGVLATAPLATIGIVADPPVAGAALLALDAVGASAPPVGAALRRAVRAAAG